MRILLDTHALIWALTDHPNLSPKARAVLSDKDAEHIVSAASVMEIFTKHRIGKLSEVDNIVRDWNAIMAPPGYTLLSISPAHARLAGQLDIPHKDPFDRLLIAQAKIENLPLMSNEAIFDDFGVKRIW